MDNQIYEYNKSHTATSDNNIEESSLSSSSNDSCNNFNIIDEEKEKVTLEDCSVVYFAGYLAYKTTKKI